MNTKMMTKAGVLLAVALGVPACALFGAEPDEIDVVDGDETGASSSLGEGDETSGGDTDTDTDSAGETQPGGDGDGDDGPGTDTDNSGDGDGDPSTTSGDGDGDPASTGDGDPEEFPCEELSIDELSIGENLVEVFAGDSLINEECGSEGPESVYEFTAEAVGEYSFVLSSDAFEGALYLSAGPCVPLGEYSCDLEGAELVRDLQIGETLYVIVDADQPGAGTVTVMAF